jgi:hypothetical protein
LPTGHEANLLPAPLQTKTLPTENAACQAGKGLAYPNAIIDYNAMRLTPIQQ